MRKPNRRGQGLTENIVTVALIAIGCIGVLTLFGDNIRKAFGNQADALGGATSMSYKPGSSGQVQLQKGLSNYGENDYGGSAAGQGGSGDTPGLWQPSK